MVLNQNRDFHMKEKREIVALRLTSYDETSLRGGQPGFTCQPVLRATLVGLVSVFGADVPDVQFAGWKNQVFPI